MVLDVYGTVPNVITIPLGMIASLKWIMTLRGNLGNITLNFWELVFKMPMCWTFLYWFIKFNVMYRSYLTTWSDGLQTSDAVPQEAYSINSHNMFGCNGMRATGLGYWLYCNTAFPLQLPLEKLGDHFLYKKLPYVILTWSKRRALCKLTYDKWMWVSYNAHTICHY